MSWFTWHRRDALDEAFGALVEILGCGRLDRQPPLRGLRAGDAIPGQQKPFRTLITEAMRPQARRGHTPDSGGRISDLRVGGGDHLVGVQRDVGAACHAVPVDLHHRRLVGAHQAAEAAHEPAHHLIVDHRIPRLIGQMVDRLRLTRQHGVAIRTAATGRRRSLGIGREVEPGAEPLAPAGDQDDVHIRIEIGPLDQGRQLQRSVGDDRVALLGPVERDPGDAVGDLVGHRLQVVEVHRPDGVSHARSRFASRWEVMP